MNGIGLNKGLLSHIHYHWFWGLNGMPSAGSQTLYDMAMELQSRSEKKEQIERLLTRVASYWSITQAFFWLFDIQGYRTGYYQYHSHASWEFYEQRDRMMSKEALEQAETAGGFMFMFSQSQQDRAVSSMVWFYNGIRSYIPMLPQITQRDSFVEADDDQVEEKPSEPDHFIITALLLTALHTLGIDKPIGESLSFADLKAAYRERLLSTHPDKTGENSDVSFIAVREAMQFVMDNLSPSLSKITASSRSDCFSEVKRRMAEMDERIARERLVLGTLGARAQRYCDRATQYCADVTQDIADAKADIAHAKADIADAKEYLAGVDRYFSKVRQAQAMLAETQAMFNALKVTHVARKRSNDAFFELAAAYEAVDAYKPAHESKRNHHVLFQAVITDISRLERKSNDSQLSLFQSYIKR